MSGAMKVEGKQTRTIWVEADGWSVGIIDQTALPHRFTTIRLTTLAEVARAIATMQVRGAPLIGATAAYGVALALRADASDEALERACATLIATRPVAINQAIGRHGAKLIAAMASNKEPGEPFQVLTHCNAGWLATVDFGTALAPVYVAHDQGVALHVWVDETRPRNQGAALTAWELGQHGVPHTVIADNTGGHLMQHGMVDMVIVGADRVTANGDVCNKIGTYLKALAAKDNGVPFYVGLPSPTIDFSVSDGLSEVPIEQRGADEVATVSGRTADGRVETVRVVPESSPVANYGFDVTPARLVTGLVTERGIVAPRRDALAAAFVERAQGAPRSGVP